jgi:hypothetical protein
MNKALSGHRLSNYNHTLAGVIVHVARDTKDEALRTKAIDGLIALLDKENAAPAACRALGELGPLAKSALPALRKAAENEKLAEEANKAIEGIEGAGGE